MNALSILRQAASLTIGLTLAVGVLYPLCITGIAEVIAPAGRMGLPVEIAGRVVGYRNIGQSWSDSMYFWGRPSSVEYRPTPSSGSNLGPTSSLLRDSIASRRRHGSDSYMIHPHDIPADMLTASGSGVDPHISPEAAYMQLSRVVRARHYRRWQIERVRSLIDSLTEHGQVGLLGMPRVNVLDLNRCLDQVVR